MTTITEEMFNKHLKWRLYKTGGERIVLPNADLRGADLSRADLSRADLSRTVMDAVLPANAEVSKFYRDAANPNYVIGYRTRRQAHMGGPPWTNGKHSPPWASRCPVTACHPGIYLQPDKVGLEGEIVEIRVHWCNVHQGGFSDDAKWRSVGEVEIAPLGTWQTVPPERVRWAIVEG